MQPVTVMRCFENGRVIMGNKDAITLFREVMSDPTATAEQLDEAVESGEIAYFEYESGEDVDLDKVLGL